MWGINYSVNEREVLYMANEENKDFNAMLKDSKDNAEDADDN